MIKDLQKRTLFAILALAIFIPILAIGGLWLQIAMGIVAMLGVHELLRMKGLNTMTLEGLLTLLATFALTVPLENYWKFLPVDGNVVAYSELYFTDVLWPDFDEEALKDAIIEYNRRNRRFGGV